PSRHLPPSLPPSAPSRPSCPVTRPGMLNVHLVPHTHDDVGWLKTVDQYFYGGECGQHLPQCQLNICLSCVRGLCVVTGRREGAFGGMGWEWGERGRGERVRFLSLTSLSCAAGRLEFINGGWCMNDEGSTHYNAMIDQMSLGFQFLNETFGECGRPRVAWHIDPFGHSREQASLFAQVREVGEGVQIPDLALYKCNVVVVVVVPPALSSVLSSCPQAKSYRTNHIIMTMGSDFQFENAHMWYSNMDKLIKYVNTKVSTLCVSL
uniref:Lysosomal alpha-mannosidase n=1 Tax=Callorhinchus milii TaxID=7868 RepID=A0A4W3HPX8_CALMI